MKRVVLLFLIVCTYPTSLGAQDAANDEERSGVFTGAGFSALGFASLELRVSQLGFSVGYLGPTGAVSTQEAAAGLKDTNRIPLAATWYGGRLYFSAFVIRNGSYALRAACDRCNATNELSNDPGIVGGYYTPWGERGIFRAGVGFAHGFKSNYADAKGNYAIVDVTVGYKLF